MAAAILANKSQKTSLIVREKPFVARPPFADEINLLTVGDFRGIDPCFQRDSVTRCKIELAPFTWIVKSQRAWLVEIDAKIATIKQRKLVALWPWLPKLDSSGSQLR